MQKILHNGRTITIFTIGTGGMFDQRVIASQDTPKPAQWHRIAVHNEQLGAYAVQKLVKKYVIQIQRFHLFSLHINIACSGSVTWILFSSMPYFSSAVYIEGDIETRIYNESSDGRVRNMQEICIRRDGMLINID